MENKQLDFNAPLISARRYSSPQRSHIHEGSYKKNETISIGIRLPHDQKLDLSLGEIVHPGSVPFRWEKSPGKVKDIGSESQHQSSPVPPSTTPKLPPGRSLIDIVPWTSSRNNSRELKPEVGAHNKLSGETIKVPRPHNRLSGRELNASGRTKTSSSHISSSMSRWEGSKAGRGRYANSDAYSDTIDSFSQLESFSICCSIISDVSGSECPGAKLPGTFSTDALARDLMMNRFLPAAKAMTLESPQYTSRRQLGIVEPPLLGAKASVPRVHLEPTPTRSDSKTIIPYIQHELTLKERSKEEDVNCDLRSSPSVKACGLLPWLLSKKDSLRFLNPVPAMKVGTRAALLYASKIAGLVKIMPQKGLGQALAKRNKVNSGVNASASHNIHGKRNRKSSPKFCYGESQIRRSLSPYKTSRQGSVSPCRNVSPQPLFHKGAGFLASPNRMDRTDDHESKLHKDHCMRSKELSSWQRRSSVVYECGIPVAEKTVYIDSMTTVRASESNSNNYSSKTSSPIGNGFRAACRSKPSTYGDRWDIMKARGLCRPPISEVVDGRLPSYDNPTKSYSSRYGSRKARADGNFTNTSGQLMVKADDNHYPITPPLPKSPSDSWLLRNLNSGSQRNSFSSLHLANKVQSKKQNIATMTYSGTKWETIVKRSHLQSDRGRYSEELVTRIVSQTRK